MSIEKNQRNLKLLVISLSISIAVIFAILLFTIDENTILSLRRIKPQFLLLALLLQVSTWFLWSIRISTMAKMISSEHRLSIRESMSIVIANLFLAAITPSMAGGEPVRIHLLSKKGLSGGCATAITLGERVFDAIFILVMVPFALFIFQYMISIREIRMGLIIGIILFISAVSLFFYMAARPEVAKKFLLKIFKKTKKEGFIERIEGFVDEFHRGSKLIFKRSNIGGIVAVSILTILSWFVGFLIPSCILVGLGHNPVILQSIAAQILLLVIIMMPTTPGSSGVAELGASALYGSFVNTSILGIFIVLWRFTTYYVNIIVSAIFQYKVLRSLLKR
ncbi:MAG: flippase-like domain-containing protein [Thermoplasmata archaeon]|nr:flippase-like domain-containing protein [Thermoplasmata archaeon]